MSTPRDPESIKRLASGFWRHQYDFECQTETWTCDKRKLHDKVAEAMLDPDFRRHMTDRGPTGTLDLLFGLGTGEAFATAVGKTDRPSVAMRFDVFNDPREMYSGIDLASKDDEMALNHYWNSNTSGTSTNTGTTSGTNFMFTDPSGWKDETRRQKQGMFKGRTPDGRVVEHGEPVFKFEKKLVKTLPFKTETGGSLLGSLQREFDHWAGAQLKLIGAGVTRASA